MTLEESQSHTIFFFFFTMTPSYFFPLYTIDPQPNEYMALILKKSKLQLITKSENGDPTVLDIAERMNNASWVDVVVMVRDKRMKERKRQSKKQNKNK